MGPAALIRNPVEYCRRLRIKDVRGRVRPTSVLNRAQLVVAEAFIGNPDLLVLKDRQRGISTIVLELFFWYMLLTPDEEALVSVTHAEGAMYIMNAKIRMFIEGLPPPLRPEVLRDTAEEIVVTASPLTRALLGHPPDAPATATFSQQVAGGRAQGRSGTFTHTHWTEVGFYPQGSASVGRETNDEGADTVAWASINATVHRTPRRRRVVESTANGPAGLFYDLVQTARTSNEWKFLFFPWFFDDQYTMRVPRGWEPTDEEQRLLKLHAHQGLTIPHLVWRRWKMAADRITLDRFRKEYPSTEDEPFMVSGESYFDLDALSALSAYASGTLCPTHQELVFIEPPIAGRRYFGGQDTCGGVGRDDATFHVLRDDGKLVCRWRCDSAAPWEQAEMGAKVSHLYNRALWLVETNNHGVPVFERMVQLGVNLWLGENNKPFWTQAGRGGLLGNTKPMLLAHMAALLGEGFFIPPSANDPWLACPLTISQLMAMREHKNRVEAPRGKKDDLAMSLCMAAWCGRQHFRGDRRKLPEYDGAADRIRNLLPGKPQDRSPWR